MKKVRSYLSKIVVMWFAFVYSRLSLADGIPGVEETSDGVGADEGLFAYSSGWGKQIVLFGVPFILACVFLWMMWELWGKINEQRNSKEPQWNGVIAFGGASVGYFLIASYLATVVVGIFA